MFKLIVKCRKANVTHMLLPSVFVAVHEEKRKEAAQHKHKEREGLEYNRRAVFENRRESLHICWTANNKATLENHGKYFLIQLFT